MLPNFHLRATMLNPPHSNTISKSILLVHHKLHTDFNVYWTTTEPHKLHLHTILSKLQHYGTCIVTQTRLCPIPLTHRQHNVTLYITIMLPDIHSLFKQTSCSILYLLQTDPLLSWQNRLSASHPPTPASSFYQWHTTIQSLHGPHHTLPIPVIV